MKSYVQWNPFTVEKILLQLGLELWTAWSVGQHLTHLATGAPSTSGNHFAMRHMSCSWEYFGLLQNSMLGCFLCKQVIYI